jgi:uncharacterized protein (DUF58 family)
LRPTGRLLGALALAGVVYLYGATSEVAWLFLFGLLLAGVAIAMYFYARWNAAGLEGGLRLVQVVPAEGSPVADLPPAEFRDAPLPAPVFERDTVRIELRLGAADGRSRGPARITVGFGASGLEAGTGLVPAEGWSRVRELGPVLRGPLAAEGTVLESGDPLGFFRTRRPVPNEDLAVAFPLFASLADNRLVREVESQLTVVRSGHGTDLYGVREYRSGDPLRRIHWRTSARRGELVVREFEPPGQRILALLLDRDPASPESADQIARLAASEAWDCLRAGGRVLAWAPGLESLSAPASRSLWGVLEWLGRWPGLPEEDSEPPRVMDAVAFTDHVAGPSLEALRRLREHGATTRAWLVGEGDLDLPFSRAGLEWPLPE